MRKMPAEGEKVQKMENALAAAQAKLQAHYCKVGKTVLQMADGELNAANALVDEIVKIKKELSQAKNERQCPECMAYNSEDSRYCRHCGTRLPAGG